MKFVVSTQPGEPVETERPDRVVHRYTAPDGRKVVVVRDARGRLLPGARLVLLRDAGGREPIRSCVVKTTDQIPMRKGKAPGTAAERRPRGQWKRMAFDIAKERGTVSIEDVVEKVAVEMPAPEPGKRDQRRGNARRDIDALIRDEFLEAIDEGKSLRLAGRGELL